MRVKIKEEFINEIPYCRENKDFKNEFEMTGITGNSLLLVDDEGNFFEVFPRKCQKIAE